MWATTKCSIKSLTTSSVKQMVCTTILRISTIFVDNHCWGQRICKYFVGKLQNRNALQKLIWSSFLWSFFDYCSSTAAFSKIFSVVEVPARWLSWEPNSVYCSSGTILLYSRNLSQSCDYISKASNTSLYMKS